MKTFLLVIILTIFSCTKKENTYCWLCEITGGYPYQDRILDTCTREANPAFGWKDANGNDLNHFCTKK